MIMNSKNKMSEKEFGRSFKNFLDKAGFESWHEVYILGKSIDSVIKINDNYISFELKLYLSEQVLFQAKKNQRFSNMSYIVIPYKRNINISPIKKYYIVNNDLGLLLFDPKESKDWEYTISIFDKKFKSEYNIWNIIQGKFKEINGIYYIKNFLHDEQKECVPGLESGSVFTPFKKSCKIILKFLENNNIKRKKEIWEALKNDLHWTSYNGFRMCFNNYPELEPLKTIEQILLDRQQKR